VSDESNDPGPAAALVLAAGAGERLGLGVPKGFVELGGRPLLQWSLTTVARSPGISAVVVVVPPDRVSEAAQLASRVGSRPDVAAVVPGGATRRDSVRLGLEALPAGTEVVVCHDAARPFASPELFARVLHALTGYAAEGAVPVVASPDTVKRIRDGVIAETIPRGEVGLAQTPQAFLVEALRAAHGRDPGDEAEATDDAMLLEAAGYRVLAVQGDPENFKLTGPADFVRAEARLLVERRSHGEEPASRGMG